MFIKFLHFNQHMKWKLKKLSIDLKTDEKTGEGEQKEKPDNQLSEVASQAEEQPLNTPVVEDKEPTQSQDDLKEDDSAKTTETVSQPSPTRTHSGRGRPPKSTPPSAQKKVPVKTEEENAVPGFQDDPSDADYAPSKYKFIQRLLKFPFSRHPNMYIVFHMILSVYVSAF